MTNIFAYRSTNPFVLQFIDDPIGPDNDEWLQCCSIGAGIVVAAWGAHGNLNNRANQVLKIIPHLHCLKRISGGLPAHPLYLNTSREYKYGIENKHPI